MCFNVIYLRLKCNLWYISIDSSFRKTFCVMFTFTACHNVVAVYAVVNSFFCSLSSIVCCTSKLYAVITNTLAKGFVLISPVLCGYSSEITLRQL